MTAGLFSFKTLRQPELVQELGLVRVQLLRQVRTQLLLPVRAQLTAAAPGLEGDAVGIQVQPPWVDPRQNCCRNLANLSASEAKSWVSLIG